MEGFNSGGGGKGVRTLYVYSSVVFVKHCSYMIIIIIVIKKPSNI